MLFQICYKFEWLLAIWNLTMTFQTHHILALHEMVNVGWQTMMEHLNWNTIFFDVGRPLNMCGDRVARFMVNSSHIRKMSVGNSILYSIVSVKQNVSSKMLKYTRYTMLYWR